MPDVFPVVLYGCETWSLTLREERRLTVFENRVLRGIFGRKRDEVTGKWRKVQMRSLVINIPHQILFGKSILKKLRWEGHVARMGDGRVVYRGLVGKPEGKRPLGRPRLGCKDISKMNVGRESMD